MITAYASYNEELVTPVKTEDLQICLAKMKPVFWEMDKPLGNNHQKLGISYYLDLVIPWGQWKFTLPAAMYTAFWK